MSLNSSFINLYDKVQQAEFAAYQTSVGSFEVNEHEAGASMKKLQIVFPGAVFSSFNHQLVKGMKDFTETRSTYLLDSDCDGISFINDNGHYGLILAELKSRFSTQHIKKAFSQMTQSFLKMHAMLSLCKDYSIDTLSLHFIAACKCFEDNDQEDSVYNILSKAEKSEAPTFEGVFLRHLIERHNVESTLGEISKLWCIPLNSSLMGKHLTMSLQLTQHYDDISSVYSF